ncbi:Hsp20/alpha crystallin family protein [Actinoallomurus sp. NPDC052274]|uniref:Hsp20/alpha crystallin family protein n=1 Tax=Actinoallomurus sp. NPDC052274 TaxID=3155420 RepID=UPI00341F73BB
MTRRHQPGTALSGRSEEFADVYDQMGGLLNAAFGGLGEEVPWVPLADVYETKDTYVIEAELPGVRKDAVDIELEDRELVITGDTVEREGRGLFRRRERRTGRFELHTHLPGEIDPDGVQASLSAGVLTVRVPRSTTERQRRIEISD